MSSTWRGRHGKHSDEALGLIRSCRADAEACDPIRDGPDDGELNVEVINIPFDQLVAARVPQDGRSARTFFAVERLDQTDCVLFLKNLPV